MLEELEPASQTTGDLEGISKYLFKG